MEDMSAKTLAVFSNTEATPWPLKLFAPVHNTVLSFRKQSIAYCATFGFRPWVLLRRSYRQFLWMQSLDCIRILWYGMLVGDFGDISEDTIGNIAFGENDIKSISAYDDEREVWSLSFYDHPSEEAKLLVFEFNAKYIPIKRFLERIGDSRSILWEPPEWLECYIKDYKKRLLQNY